MSQMQQEEVKVKNKRITEDNDLIKLLQVDYSKPVEEYMVESRYDDQNEERNKRNAKGFIDCLKEIFKIVYEDAKKLDSFTETYQYATEKDFS